MHDSNVQPIGPIRTIRPAVQRLIDEATHFDDAFLRGLTDELVDLRSSRPEYLRDTYPTLTLRRPPGN